jgi:hypothetical protein
MPHERHQLDRDYRARRVCGAALGAREVGAVNIIDQLRAAADAQFYEKHMQIILEAATALAEMAEALTMIETHAARLADFGLRVAVEDYHDAANFIVRTARSALAGLEKP